jgi:thiamine transport system permease protein
MVARAGLVGAAFAFVVSLGEFGATQFIVRPDRPTVPTTIYRLLARPGELTFSRAMALSVVLMVMTVVVALSIERTRPGGLGGF